MARTTRTINIPEDTRMQRDRLTAEQESAQQARKGELSMITAKENADDAEGLWDPFSGDLIGSGLSEKTEAHLAHANAALMADEDEIIPVDQAQVGIIGQHQIRTDGPSIGPNGVPIDAQALFEEEDTVTVAADTNAANRTPVIPDAPMVGAGHSPARTVQRLDRAKETRVIRINSDLDPTIGREQYHFLKGKRYQVPIHVAMHLHEKGFVSSFG